MGLLQTAAADVEAIWTEGKEVAEQDVSVIASGVKSFLVVATPSLWAALLDLGQDIVNDVVTDPSGWTTAFLNQASAAAIAEWSVLKPELQSAIASVIAGIKAVGTAV